MNKGFEIGFDKVSQPTPTVYCVICIAPNNEIGYFSKEILAPYMPWRTCSLYLLPREFSAKCDLCDIYWRLEMGLLKDTSDVVNSILKWINGCNQGGGGLANPLRLKMYGPFSFRRKLYNFFFGNGTFSDF